MSEANNMIKEAISIEDTLKLALEALKYHTAQTRPIHQTNEAIKALEDALEAHKALAQSRSDMTWVKPHEWRGLTEKEVREVWSNFNSGLDTAMNFYNAVETKLKEKTHETIRCN